MFFQNIKTEIKTITVKKKIVTIYYYTHFHLFIGKSYELEVKIGNSIKNLMLIMINILQNF